MPYNSASITIDKLGKRFNRQWIFRGLTDAFSSGHAYAITGPNGSGKSTLLQLIAGVSEKSEGEIIFNIDGKVIPQEDHFRYVAVCAPYQELIEELTLTEFLHFHQQFRPWLQGFDVKSIIDLLDLQAAAHKLISQFSSGMKQRVKLAQCMLSDVPVVMLDEPTSNFDDKGIELYHRLVKEYSSGRLLIVASNHEQEISFCTHRVFIPAYKSKTAEV